MFKLKSFGDLEIGNKYNYECADNTFEVIGVYIDSIWIVWCGNGEIETMYINDDELKLIYFN